MEAIILMNLKFIRIQICLNRSKQVNIFALICQNIFLERKTGRQLPLISSMKSVHTYVQMNL